MSGDPSGDPATDPRANYDYVGEREHRSDLVSALRERVDGEVRFDEYSRQLYATDASAYEVTPVGVVFPTSTDDIAAAVSHCAAEGVPVLPRGGGTSLAGQAVNEAVVLDFTRHMDAVSAVDPDARTARAQPGVVLADLNRRLDRHGLKFAPDPAWGDKSTLGGAVGNNSTGAHSLQYGKTDAYVEECEVVLADGTVTTLGEMSLADLRERGDPEGTLEERVYAEAARIVDEEADVVEDAYPSIERNVSGYNLDRLVAEANGTRDGSAATRDAVNVARGDSDDETTVNLAHLLAGSEGTLAVITDVTVSLEPIPETKSMALLAYEDVLDAMADVTPILEHEPAAVELVDDVLIDLARNTAEFEDVVAMLPSGTDSVLLVEFYADDAEAGERAVANLLADRVPGVAGVAEPDDGAADTTDAPPEAVGAMEAHDDTERARFWKLRKSGLPILLSRTSDEKHISFVEDTAVPPEALPAYVADVQAVLDDHDTFASFYAHAGPGCLHVRPLVNTKTEAGVERMESIADAVTDLVVEYGGSVSGEHGDGRARTQWNRKLYGEAVWSLFRDLKTAFDPDWLLNPGQVCGARDASDPGGDGADTADSVGMTDGLRFSPAYSFDADVEPTLNWENDGGFQGMVELCHGCGGCRGGQETTGGVMCPTYRAADEEVLSTRGRANMLRQAMSGDLPDDPTSEEFVHEVLDLCIGCKGCKRDCPSEVDMAKLKAEVTHARHEREGATYRDRAFANVETLSRLGSAFAPLSNWLPELPGARRLLEWTAGVARERDLPTFRRETFVDWAESRNPGVSPEAAERRALVLPDTYTNYAHPEVGTATVRVLEAAGVHVRVPTDVRDLGRPAFSKGFLDTARDRAAAAVDALAPRVVDGWDVVAVEPSDAAMVQSDYRDLLSGEDVDRVAANTYGVCEYLDRERLDVPTRETDERLAYHGHCHQTALKKDHHAVAVLRRAGYAVDPLDSGCCGMAGSFGYEAEHYSMSRAIGRILFEQVDASDAATVVAPGTSCRTQLGDREEAADPPHPVEKLAAALE